MFANVLSTIYRIRANKPPLLIKPPLFCPKSPLFGAFLGKFWKNFNKPPPQNLDFFIDRRQFIDTDTVLELDSRHVDIKI